KLIYPSILSPIWGFIISLLGECIVGYISIKVYRLGLKKVCLLGTKVKVFRPEVEALKLNLRKDKCPITHFL
ncbi:MAG: hypothetical protein E7K92_25020, partial [Serratia marcescens]|nr:hypothetical protein [Serratia marcescens]